MTEPSGARRVKSPWLVGLAVVSALGLGCCGLGVLAVGAVPALLLGDEGWTSSAVSPGDVPRVFGVTLTATPAVFRSRAFGFQDPVYEVLIKLTPAEAEAFMAANRLSEGPAARAPLPHDTWVQELQRHDGKGPVPAGVELQGLKDLMGGDGGWIALHREGRRVERGGAVWFLLTAFGT